jgi:hypothetical protein
LTNSSASGDHVRVVRPRRRRRDLGCTLTDLDHRLLDLLCSLRVVRQDQLERLFPEVPERTLRHRMRRLHEHGLAGRSRPYRERGSAPNHHWPTRRAAGVARGEPVPRGGDRGEPNPLLEPFRDSSRERTLAPDALVVLVNERDEPSFAFVEMDLGTMSHTRLRAKAEMYASYAASDAWRGACEFLPALVFLTTSEPRALRFLHMLREVIEQHKRRHVTVRLVAAAGPVVFAPGRVLAEACLTHLDGETQVTLIDVLNEARAPFDRERRAAEKRRQTKERKRTEIREDPLLVRRLLLRESEGIASYLEELDAVGRTAVQIAVASRQDDLSAQERAMFEVFGNELGDILIEPGFRRAPVPKEAAVRAVSDLVEHYRSAQLRRINELTARYGEGPALRQARATLDAGELLDARTMRELTDQARSNSGAKIEQARQRVAYEQWREHAAAGRVRQTGLLKQLAHSRDEFYAEIDAEHLWVCGGCRETVYPKLDATGGNGPTKDYCHYCRRPPRGKRTGITGGVALYR